MANQQHPKARLVKCPKCARILPEPKHVPLYTCGGCGTILQAKHYKGKNESLSQGSNGQPIEQSNGINHSSDGGESSGSSRKSSSYITEESAKIERQDLDAAENSRQSVQNGATDSAYQTSILADESSFPTKRENGEIINTTIDKSQSRDHVLSEDPIALVNTESAEQTTAAAAINDNNGQCDDTAVENHSRSQQQRRNLHDDGKTYTSDEKKESEQPQPAFVIEAIEDNDDQHDQGQVEDEREASTSHTSEYQVEGNASDGEMSRKDTERKHSCEDIPREEINSNCLDSADKPKVPQLAKEDGNREDQNNSVECMTEQLLTEAPLSTEIIEYGSKSDMFDEPSRKNIESSNDSAVYESEQVQCSNTPEISEAVSTHKEVDGLLNAVARPPSKNSLVNDGSVSSSDENVHQVPVQLEVARLANEYGNRKEQNNSVECMTEKLSTETPLSAEITECGSKSEIVRVTSGQTFDKSKDNAVYESEQLQCTDKPEISVAVGMHKQVDGLLKEVPRSPTKNSLAYDGSISSSEENDNQVPGQYMHVTAEENPKWDNLPSDKMTSNYLETRPQAKSFSSTLLPKKLKSSIMEEEENRIPGPGRNRTGNLNINSFMHRVPNYRRSADMAFETGSSSSYVHDDPPFEQMRRRPYRSRYHGYVDRSRDHGWKEKEFLPMYYDYETSGEIYHGAKYHGYTDRRRRAESWSISGPLPPMPSYSGEVFNGRYQNSEPYVHRHHDNLRWSGQLPPHAFCCRPKWDPYDSYSTSPQRYADLEPYSWAHDTVSVSDDQRHKDEILRRVYLREKRQAVKRHVQPLAGGAPFITCYFCLNVLQLPQHSLLPGRKSNRLKCGACSKVVEVSLEKEGCLSGASNIDRNTILDSSANGNHSHGSSLITANGRELLPQDSLGRGQRKMVPGNSRSGDRMIGSHDAEPPESLEEKRVNVTWQLPARSKSPLHRLMGYSTPQDLLTAHEADTEYNSSGSEVQMDP
ncbi:hypothetical protein BVRB_5g120230 [Beta vulgaris subsp. vulgaris]|nr:hypothetical protein BVRB_5g120230 [Beta vulgaris subsp. vulgaris]